MYSIFNKLKTQLTIIHHISSTLNHYFIYLFMMDLSLLIPSCVDIYVCYICSVSNVCCSQWNLDKEEYVMQCKICRIYSHILHRNPSSDVLFFYRTFLTVMTVSERGKYNSINNSLSLLGICVQLLSGMSGFVKCVIIIPWNQTKHMYIDLVLK